MHMRSHSSKFYCIHSSSILFTIDISDPHEKKKRKSRMCPYCQRWQQNLRRHLTMKHHYEAEVYAILSDKTLSKLQVSKAFARIRNRGILLNNSKKDSDFTAIHCGTQGDIVHCSTCQGAYSARSFYRHRKNCTSAALKLKANTIGEPKTKFALLLSNFRNNDVGNTCRSDKYIKLFGYTLFQKEKTKVEKYDEVVKSVSNDMRLLARLLLHTKLTVPDDVIIVDASDLVDRKYWPHVRDAIDQMTTDADASTLKHGLKLSLYYVIMRFCDCLVGEYLSLKGHEEEILEVENFKKLLKHHQNHFFGDAKYKTNLSRQETLRLPSRLPDESDVQRLRDYSVSRIEDLTKQELDSSSFVELRNLVCSRLTIFNARRGGEDARLSIEHWTKRKQWIRKDQEDQLKGAEKEFFNEMEVMFSNGLYTYFLFKVDLELCFHF